MSLPDPMSYSGALLAPMVVLVGMAFWVPVWFARRLTQDFRGLGINLLLSSLFLWFCALGIVAGLYVWQKVPLGALLTGLPHIGFVAAQSVLIWVPIVLLQLAMQPQHWRPDL